MELAETELQRKPLWRVIATCHSPIDLFEHIVETVDFDAVIELEIMFSPHYNEVMTLQGGLPRSEWVFGQGAGYVMAPFVYRFPSRFSDGSFGVFYAGLEEETALSERAHHLARLHAATNDPSMLIDELILRAKATGQMVDIRGQHAAMPQVYDSVDYVYAQGFGGAHRNNGAEGILYSSVRRSEGGCIAVFRPKVVSECRQSRHITMEWDPRAKAVRWA